jgi:uroporphyrinogen-III synthase
MYRTALPRRPEPLQSIGGCDMITFTSASTVENFARLAGDQARTLLDRCAVAAIGPITAAALERIGVVADVVAHEYTIDALVADIVRYFANRQPVK